jgi:hypothetical protein
MPNQFLMYDTAILNWVTAEFKNLLVGRGGTFPDKPGYVLIGTPDRAYSEYVTPVPIDPDGVPPLPRIAITIEDFERNEELFNIGTLRKLGWADDTTKTHIRRAEYPLSINQFYTINFWTEYHHEMQLFVQKVYELFRHPYVYIPVDINSISPAPVTDAYETYNIGVHLEGPVSDTGDVEPGNQERIMRRTWSIRFASWLWDYNFLTAGVLKDVEMQFYGDRDLTQIIETYSIPRKYNLFVGTGAQVTFSGNLDGDILPVIENTFILDSELGGESKRVFDDGAGNLIGDEVSSGTIDYDTGAVAITYVNPPDAGDITTTYYTTRE